jgi:hypothetical protein
MHSFLFACDWKVISLRNSKNGLDVGLTHYGMVFVQWYVWHSHERRLAGSMNDDEFEVCFELLLSVVLAKRRKEGMRCGFTCQSHIPGARQ